MNDCTLKELYPLLFVGYPDLVNVTQMCAMLGGISVKTGYRLLKSGKIRHLKVGREYRIPKLCLLEYLAGENENGEILGQERI